jgi:hypothetical protein
MAVVAGLFLLVALVVAPGEGGLARAINTLRLNVGVAQDDILALAYRAEERKERGLEADELGKAGRSVVAARGGGLSRRVAQAAARRRVLRRGLVVREGGLVRLTESGRALAAGLVRTHRLWEDFLHEQGRVKTGELHFAAEQLEHVTTPEITAGLVEGHVGEAHVHGAPVPPDVGPEEPRR